MGRDAAAKVTEAKQTLVQACAGSESAPAGFKDGGRWQYSIDAPSLHALETRKSEIAQELEKILDIALRNKLVQGLERIATSRMEQLRALAAVEALDRPSEDNSPDAFRLRLDEKRDALRLRLAGSQVAGTLFNIDRGVIVNPSGDTLANSPRPNAWTKSRRPGVSLECTPTGKPRKRSQWPTAIA